MSYILCLAFKSIVYKTPPLIRCSINNIFIDEFYIDQFNLNQKKIKDNDNEWSEQFNKIKSHSNWRLSGKHYKESLLKENLIDFYSKDVFFKFFELDEVVFKEHNNLVQINFDCNNNNYTNGFLTKNTMIQLLRVHCCPKSILQNYNIFFNNFKKNDKNIRKDFSIDWYKEKPTLFNIIESNRKYTWYNKFFKKFNEVILETWIGGLGTIQFSFDKDLLQFTENSFFKYQVDFVELYTLANKYIEYENYGNNN